MPEQDLKMNLPCHSHKPNWRTRTGKMCPSSLPAWRCSVYGERGRVINRRHAIRPCNCEHRLARSRVHSVMTGSICRDSGTGPRGLLRQAMILKRLRTISIWHPGCICEGVGCDLVEALSHGPELNDASNGVAGPQSLRTTSASLKVCDRSISECSHSRKAMR